MVILLSLGSEGSTMSHNLVERCTEVRFFLEEMGTFCFTPKIKWSILTCVLQPRSSGFPHRELTIYMWFPVIQKSFIIPIKRFKTAIPLTQFLLFVQHQFTSRNFTQRPHKVYKVNVWLCDDKSNYPGKSKWKWSENWWDDFF